MMQYQSAVHSSSLYKRPSYNLIIFAISMLYALVLASQIPMSGVINDRLNYLEYAESSSLIVLRYLSEGLISFIFNEPVWLGINIGLGFYLSPENIVASIVFFSAFTSSYLLLRVNPKAIFFLIFLLFVPQVIGKYVVHLRQGLAISFFLLAWFTVSKPWRWFFFSLTPLIHASFFFILFLLAYTTVLKRFKFAIDLRTIAVVFLGLFINFILVFVASAVGVRQAEEYEFTGTAVSGLGFIFWLGVFVIYWLQGRDFTRDHAFAMAVLAFYLSTYFFIEVTARIFESAVIIILLAGLGLTGWRKRIFYTVLVIFVLLSWLSRLNQPWFGWGADL